MVANNKNVDFLFDYILKLSKGNNTKEQYNEYSKYLENCNPVEVNLTIDKFIEKENDFDHIEKTVAKFIRACEHGLESGEKFKTQIPYLSLLIEENSRLEELKNDTTVIYKEFVSEFKKTGQIETQLISKLKESLINYYKIKPHYIKLQNSLFPSLEKYSNNMNCLKLMWHIQDSVLNSLKELINIIKTDPFDFAKFNKMYGDMFLKLGKLKYREETILFPLAVSVLPNSEFSKLLIDVDELKTAFDVDVFDYYGGNNMSDSSNEKQERKNDLIKIIKALNNSKDKKSVQKEIYKEFKNLLDTLSPEELVEAEQALIAEGLPIKEVIKHCELHVDTFHKALKGASKRTLNGDENISGHPIANYKAENKVLKAKIKDFNKICKNLKKTKDFDAFDNAINDLLKIDLHYFRKERQLFPFLEEVAFCEPAKLMWAKHDEIRDLFKELKLASTKKNIKECSFTLKLLFSQLKRMIFIEEKILFPTALKKLPESAWIKIKEGEDKLGYAWIEVENQWNPKSLDDNNQSESTNGIKNNLVDLSVGQLSANQIDLILKNLPLDVTYVDENDKVRYFSQGKERIFPRLPSIIGRDVKNCHPPKSVHVVEKIIEDFKEGKRDVAEFWIELKGVFIYIRYVPLFEEDVYKGVLEISQDITSIKNLAGEKRLLDELV